MQADFLMASSRDHLGFKEREVGDLDCRIVDRRCSSGADILSNKYAVSVTPGPVPGEFVQQLAMDFQSHVRTCPSERVSPTTISKDCDSSSKSTQKFPISSSVRYSGMCGNNSDGSKRTVLVQGQDGRKFKVNSRCSIKKQKPPVSEPFIVVRQIESVL